MKLIRFKSKKALLEGQPDKGVLYYLGYSLIYLGLLIIILVLAWLTIKAGRIYITYRTVASHVANLQTLVTVGQANPSKIDLVQLEDSLHETATGLERLSIELTPFLPLTAYLDWVPIYGGDIEAAPYLLAAGRDVSQTGVLLAERFAPLLEANREQTTFLTQATLILTQAQADLDQARKLIQQAQADLGEVDSERLSPPVARQIAPLQQYLPLTMTGLELAKRLPILLGVESPQIYLILTQNSDELRPSGGYITTAGHIVVDRGQVVELVMQDSYAADRISELYPYPPDPIYQYMAADYWLLRDASWWPDFPTTARTAIALYEMGQGVSAKGVFALDQQALPLLLRAFEPVEVNGEQVTSQNVINLMRQHWAPEDQEFNTEWWLQRKSFMLRLAEAIRQKFEEEPHTINLSVLLTAFQQALIEKHLAIYVEDPTWAAFLAQKNWVGSLSTVQGDYLMVADANLGFNKASALVERRLNYNVILTEDGGVQAYANLVYQHLAQKHIEKCRQEPRYDPLYEQNMERCYWNYLSLIVPAGAELLNGPRVIVDGQYLLRGQSTTGEIDVMPLGADKISWGQLFLLAPAESLSLDYVYILPPGTAQIVDDHWEYTLYLQKQLGALEPPVEVMITLPEGAQLLESWPQPRSQKKSVVTYQIDLKTDREIKILYTLP